MATVRENIKNALNWFYDRLKDKYIDPFNERITTNTNDIATNTANIATNTANIEKNTTDISQLNSDLTSSLNGMIIETGAIDATGSKTISIKNGTFLFLVGLHHASSYGEWFCAGNYCPALVSSGTSLTVTANGDNSFTFVNPSSGTNFRYIAFYVPA